MCKSNSRSSATQWSAIAGKKHGETERNRNNQKQINTVRDTVRDTHIHTGTHTCTRTSEQTQKQTHWDLQTNPNTYMHTNTDIHTNTHTHPHTQTTLYHVRVPDPGTLTKSLGWTKYCRVTFLLYRITDRSSAIAWSTIAGERNIEWCRGTERHTYTEIQKNMRWTNTHKDAQTHTSTNTNIYIRTYTSNKTQTPTNTHTNTHTHTQTHTHTHNYTQTSTHIYKHTHTRTTTRVPRPGTRSGYLDQVLGGTGIL